MNVMRFTALVALTGLIMLQGCQIKWPGERNNTPGVKGEGEWADADLPTMTISASQLIWKFFAAHPKL